MILAGNEPGRGYTALLSVGATTHDADGVRARALVLVEIEEVERLLASAGTLPFTAAELAYARARSDSARRLAARLAAKRAAIGLLGADLEPHEVEVVRADYGAPALRLSSRAHARLLRLGAARTLVSLTHERRHAAALVLLLEAP